MDDYSLCSENISELAAAMLKVQADLQPVFKDQLNPEYQSRYATLTAVMEACRAALLSHGIWLAQYPLAGQAGHLELVSKIVHAASGQWQASILHMPLPKDDPQGYGSAMTYARRYGLSALLGIVCEPDDDGAATLNSDNKGADKQPAAPSQAKDTGQNKKTASSGSAVANMPKLEGVEYSTTQEGGKLRIIAFGNTYNKKKILAQSGFQWDEQQKVWWRFANAA